MTIWFVFAVFIGATLFLLLFPLFRRSLASAPRADYDIVVYRDQLSEVGRDQDRGLLSEAEAEAVRTEIYRRMLAAEDAELAGKPRLSQRLTRSGRLWLSGGLICALPTAALLLYSQLGAPDLPDRPMAERLKEPDYAISRLAEEAEARLSQFPDPDGYVQLAGMYSSLKLYDEASSAYRKALAMGNSEATTWTLLAESLVLANDGNVVKEAVQDFGRAWTLDNQEPRARFYLGLSKAQAGNFRAAVAIWRDLEKDAPQGAAWLDMVKDHIADYANQGGFKPEDILPSPPQIAVTGLGLIDPEDQTFFQQMIAKQVDDLRSAPEDVDGWLRLGRSYRVLGQLTDAQKAFTQAVSLRPKNINARLALAEVQLDEIKNGDLTPEFVQNMRAVMALSPDNVDALYYVGKAESRAGHIEVARRLWAKAVGLMQEDSPEKKGIQRELDALRK